MLGQVREEEPEHEALALVTLHVPSVSHQEQTDRVVHSPHRDIPSQRKKVKSRELTAYCTACVRTAGTISVNEEFTKASISRGDTRSNTSKFRTRNEGSRTRHTPDEHTRKSVVDKWGTANRDGHTTANDRNSRVNAEKGRTGAVECKVTLCAGLRTNARLEAEETLPVSVQATAAVGGLGTVSELEKHLP